MVVTCTNLTCSEKDVPKTGLPGVTIPADTVIRCGVCGQPCTVIQADAKL